MLYYYSSAEYLVPLHKMVSDIINNVADPALNLAKTQGRDQQLSSKRWGARDTSQNWSNNAWPFLKDLQSSLARDIATRPYGEYRKTAVNDCMRGIDEYSTDWMTDQEEQKLRHTMARISDYALPHDHTLDSYQNWWDDYEFFSYFKNFAADNSAMPQFRVRSDISALTGEVPPVTGVYIANNDPHANLQFLWSEKGGPVLREAKTFNDIGLAALAKVGRGALWADEKAMFDFAMSEEYTSLFRPSIYVGGQSWISAAPAVVASRAFKSAPAKWSLVEIVPGKTQLLDTLEIASSETHFNVQQARGGTSCVTDGFYFTPSSLQSRRFFVKGDIFPNVNSNFGDTYWQWDDEQGN